LDVPRRGHSSVGEHVRVLTRVDRWVWFNGAASLTGVLPIVLSLTVHDHGTNADPACIRHCYTLVHVAGPGALGFTGAPLVISLMTFALLPVKHARHGRYADQAAWWLCALSCLVCVGGLLTSVSLAMLPVAPLTLCAVATAP
jgi:hypothetical protein